MVVQINQYTCITTALVRIMVLLVTWSKFDQVTEVN